MTRSTTRRQFIWQSAAAGAAIAIGPRGAWSHTSPNRALNIASIGVGGIGQTVLNQFKQENIVAICDVDANNLAKAAKAFPKAKQYRDYRKMLEEMDTIEAVTVSTPDHTHAAASMMAMKMGKHVYCQKPLTHSIYEARMMAETARKQKVVTQMGNQGHSYNGVREVKEIIQSGAIGPVKEVHAWTNRPGNWWPQGIDRPKATPDVPKHLEWDLWLGPAPERPYHPAYHPFKWRGWWDFGTGALGDMACHVMDPVYFALEPGFPTRVEEDGDPRKPQSGPNWETIRMEFPARKEMPAVKVTWYDGIKDGKRNLPDPDLAPGVKMDKLESGSLFVGKKGTLVCLGSYGRRWKLLPEKNFEGFEKPEATLPRVKGENHYMDWARGCKGEGKPCSNFDYAGPFTEMVLIGVVAFRTGKTLDWDAKNMKATNAPEADKYVRREYRKGWSL